MIPLFQMIPVRRSLCDSVALYRVARRYLVSFSFLVILVASTSWGYVPPAAFIVKNVVSKRDLSKAIRIRSTVTVFDSERTNNFHFKLSHFFHPDTGLFHSVLADDSGRVIYQFENQLRGGAISLAIPVQAIGVLLLDPDWIQVVQVLRKQGLRIPSLAVLEAGPASAAGGEGSEAPKIETVVGPEATAGVLKPLGTPSAFLARWNKAVAWVVGERKGANQFWVEKDSFLPLRWLDKTELTFENYKLTRDLPYPRVITVSEKNKVLFKEELVDIKVPAPGDSIRQRGESLRGFTSFGMELPDATRALIQRYFEDN